MPPVDFESLLQLGFAATVAVWLIHWVTVSMAKTLSSNTKALLGVQLFMAELYRLMLHHDATMRAVDQHDGPAGTEQHEQAKKIYQQASARLEELKAAIQKTLDELGSAK